MDRRHLVALFGVLVALVSVAVVLSTPLALESSSPGADHRYPAGAGPDHVNFSVLDNDSANVSHTPRQHWDSYAIRYSAPAERPIVEGEYFIDSATGAVVGQRWHDAAVYINGSTYAFVQPAETIPTDRKRAEFEADPAFVYDNATDAYYRYDPQYGRVAPTNIGRHTRLLESYTWEATGTTTHHGVPVITYRVTGTRTDDARTTPANGTLRLGVENGVVYAYDITLDAEKDDYHYTYTVEPAPFPDHEWVDGARAVAANDANSSSGQ